ncbi:ATP-dependent DNA helicase RecG [bacterium]|nr:ATP-dependent DNA helicase RecG [bacterium]RQV92066.1 MAG: ATP-dependent DNA helicase RecG [bacterium]
MPSHNQLKMETPVQFVKGIGPKRATLLKRVFIETVEDLLTYFPRRYLDRSQLTQIRHLKAGEEVTVMGKVLSCETVRGRVSRYMLLLGDGTGILQCVWFRGVHYISKVFQIGDRVAFNGKITYYHGPQLVHPEYDKISEEGESDPVHTGRIIPMYPSTEALSRSGLDSRGFRRILRGVLDSMTESIPETLSQEIIRNQKLVSLSYALANIHFPQSWKGLRQAQHRLKFEELFFLQLFLALQRKTNQVEKKGIVFQIVGEQTKQLVDRLPFELTQAQKRVLHEIRRDMKKEQSMNRLLQGDVGSGKTIVALVAMLIAVENGFQAALMAPTEILAEQHYINVHGWLEDLGVQVALLKGGQRESERREILRKMSEGEINIVVGTHALVQESVCFKQLGFVVIDEQHRFGVMQRAVLRQKGYHPDVLVMTATPIPRTLTLTLYGDLDISIIDEMPAGRKPIRTFWRKEDKRDEIYTFIRREIGKGRQAYVVYPLVEESEKVDLADATAGYEMLSKQIFPEYKLALIHGRMKAEEKEKIMGDFTSGGIHILVSTTVIEVGVDVPNATVMLIEHAERFGLSQLHQLRGRVGRGEDQATCILLSQYQLSDDAVKRLKTMVETTDGFRIAEVDLQLRGPGEICGTRQHGILDFKIANLITDESILTAARKETFQLVEADFHLEQFENQQLRDTYLKRYQEKMGLMKVG